MKCQNCGRNEATYYYKSSINGRVTETHLCADCARKLGYVQRMQPDSFFGDDFFSHPFRLFEPLLGGFGNRLLTEFPEPVDVTRQAQQAVAEAPEDALVDKAEQERFSLQRQRNALQTQLRHAVEASSVPPAGSSGVNEGSGAAAEQGGLRRTAAGAALLPELPLCRGTGRQRRPPAAPPHPGRWQRGGIRLVSPLLHRHEARRGIRILHGGGRSAL